VAYLRDGKEVWFFREGVLNDLKNPATVTLRIDQCGRTRSAALFGENVYPDTRADRHTTDAMNRLK